MPCDEVRQRVREAPNEMVILAMQEPYAQAARKEARKRSFQIAPKSRVRVFREIVQIEISGVGWYNIGTLETLHDMALLFIPAPKPGEPITLEYFRAHKHPKAPKDLMDKPLPPEPQIRRTYRRVETSEGYHYEEIIEVIEEPKVAEAAPAPKKKLTAAERKKAMEFLEEKALREALEAMEKR